MKYEWQAPGTATAPEPGVFKAIAVKIAYSEPGVFKAIAVKIAYSEPGGFKAISRWSSEGRATPPETDGLRLRIPEGCQP